MRQTLLSAVTLLLLLVPALSAHAQAGPPYLVINEVDADTPGTDTAEFVELYNRGTEPIDLADYVLVFYNGSNDQSYYSVDLDGFTLAPGGFFLVGNTGVNGAAINFPDNGLQNGADAVALYRSDAASFPNNTPVTGTDLVDALVYDTDDADDAGLLAALGQTVQYNENENGTKDAQSIQRVPDGSDTFVVADPTPTSGVPTGEATFAFGADEYSTMEGEEGLIVTVVINGDATEETAVRVRLAPGTLANSGDLSDFTAETVTFPAGTTDGTSMEVVITATQDDMIEGLENAMLYLEDPADESGIALDRVNILIEDDDVPKASQIVLFEGVEGMALVDSLQKYYTPDQTLGYNFARDTMAFIDGRMNPMNEDSLFVEDVYTGKIVAFPTNAIDPSGSLLTDGLNAEHIWPQSKGVAEEPFRSDMHYLYYAEASANSTRSNLPYDELVDADVTKWLYNGTSYMTPLTTTSADLYSEATDMAFEPKESFKGNAARAALYAAVIRYAQIDKSFLDAQRDVLLAWANADPADSLEHARSIAIAHYQGNQNPFVLDSTLLRRVFTEPITVEVATIAEARERVGQTVIVEGVLASPDYGFRTGQFFLQDATAGINVFSRVVGGVENATPFAAGDSIRLTGTVLVYNGLTEVEITSAANYEILSHDNPLPEPVVIPVAAATIDSPHQGERVTVRAVTLTDESAWPEVGPTGVGGVSVYVRNAWGDTLQVYLDNEESAFYGSPRPQGYFNLTGTLTRYNDTPQLMPFFETDLVAVPDRGVYSIASARDMAGEKVMIEGIITTPDYGAYDANFFMQDVTGGIMGFSRQIGGALDNSPFMAGDSVRIDGTIGAYNDLIQINFTDSSDYTILSRGNDLPAPKVLKLDEATVDSEFQGMRVTVEGLTLTPTSPWPVTKIGSGSGVNAFAMTMRGDSIVIRIDRDESFFDESPRPDGWFDLTGVLGRFKGDAQIFPFYENELVARSMPDAAEPQGEMPKEFALQGNYPNPFNPSTTIRFDLPSASEVSLEVYDVLGRRVMAVPAQTFGAGASQVIGLDGSSLASGAYFYKLTAVAGGKSTTATGKMMLVR